MMHARRTGLLALTLAIVFTAALALCAESPAEEGKHWSYAGDTGPSHWGELNEQYSACSLGKKQSPVDIAHPQYGKLPAIEFNYKPSELAVVNNGHTIQVNYAPGSSIVLDGKTYDLVQFHFHHLSETTINGQHAPLEGHLVHKSKDGNLVVVAVLFKEGAANRDVSTVWSNLPKAEGSENKPAQVEVNAAQLLPDKHTYYTFPGSLTTPPCTEGVTWLVMVHKMTASKEQIDAFAALYPDNSRPVQSLNGRTILTSKK
jgi:carbonic anhydrase